MSFEFTFTWLTLTDAWAWKIRGGGHSGLLSSSRTPPELDCWFHLICIFYFEGKTRTCYVSFSNPEAELEIEHLFVSDITADSFRVSWTADEDLFDRFVIRIRDGKRLAHPQEYSVRGDVRTKVLTGLMGGTEYEIELYGVTLDQRSQPITGVAQTGTWTRLQTAKLWRLKPKNWTHSPSNHLHSSVVGFNPCLSSPDFLVYLFLTKFSLQLLFLMSFLCISRYQAWLRREECTSLKWPTPRPWFTGPCHSLQWTTIASPMCHSREVRGRPEFLYCIFQVYFHVIHISTSGTGDHAA